jgi:hypothetical protein
MSKKRIKSRREILILIVVVLVLFSMITSECFYLADPVR